MKTKEVFPTDEVAHIWANQRQHHARNSANNVSFYGRNIKSYSTTQAELMKDNTHIVFIVDYNYSNTTAKHVSAIKQATSHKKQVFVRYPAEISLYSENFWKNIEDMRYRAIQSLEASNKPKIQAKTRIKCKEDAIVQLNRIVEFLEVFGLTIDTLKNKETQVKGKHCEKATFDYTIKLVKERASILDAENHLLDEYTKQKDKAQKQKEKARVKVRAEKLVKANEYLKKWLKGADIDSYYFRDIIEQIYLRAIPKDSATEVQTSFGARVSLKRAKVLHTALKQGKNVLGFDIDGYIVVENNEIHLKVGCHIILKSEINRFAKLMKW